MLGYDRIDISKGIDISKTNASKECDICDYRVHFWCMSKDDAITIMRISNLNEKTRSL